MSIIRSFGFYFSSPIYFCLLQFPTHTWQSLRERFMKKFKPRLGAMPDNLVLDIFRQERDDYLLAMQKEKEEAERMKAMQEEKEEAKRMKAMRPASRQSPSRGQVQYRATIVEEEDIERNPFVEDGPDFGMAQEEVVPQSYARIPVPGTSRAAASPPRAGQDFEMVQDDDVLPQSYSRLPIPGANRAQQSRAGPSPKRSASPVRSPAAPSPSKSGAFVPAVRPAGFMPSSTVKRQLELDADDEQVLAGLSAHAVPLDKAKRSRTEVSPQRRWEPAPNVVSSPKSAMHSTYSPKQTLSQRPAQSSPLRSPAHHAASLPLSQFHSPMAQSSPRQAPGSSPNTGFRAPAAVSQSQQDRRRSVRDESAEEMLRLAEDRGVSAEFLEDVQGLAELTRSSLDEVMGALYKASGDWDVAERMLIYGEEGNNEFK
jgi:hypothetical protein